MCCWTRHIQLLLGLATLLFLFAPIVLLHLTSVLHSSVDGNIRPFQSLASAHPTLNSEDKRFKRAISAASPSLTQAKSSEGRPVVNDVEGKRPLPIYTPTPRPSTTAAPTTFIFSNAPEASKKAVKEVVPQATTPFTLERAAEEETEPPPPPLPATTTPKPVSAITEKAKRVERTTAEPEDLKNAGFDDDKSSEKQKSSSDPFDTTRRTLIFAIAGLGMLLAIPFAIIVTKQQKAKILAVCALITSAVVTAATPFLGVYAVGTFRLIEGICFALAIPLVHCVIVEWAPLRNRATFLATLLSSLPLAVLFTWPITQLSLDFDLPDFTPNAIVAVGQVLTALAVALLFKQHPHEHTRISGEELSRIRAGKSKEQLQIHRALSNVRSSSFWAVFTSFFAFFVGQAVVWFYLPAILASPKVMLAWSVGFTAARPFVAFFVLFLLLALLPSTATSARVLNTVALFSSAVWIISLPFWITNESLLPLLYLLLIPLALFAAGAIHLSVVHAPARTIPAVFIPLALAMSIVPAIVQSSIEKNYPLEEWLFLLLIIGLVMCVAAAPFMFFARAAEYPRFVETTLRTIDDDEECGLRELQLLPPSGKHLN